MVRKWVRTEIRYRVTTKETSRVDHTETYSNYIGNKRKSQLQRKHDDQANWLYRSYGFDIDIILKDSKTTCYSKSITIRMTSHDDHEIPHKNEKKRVEI